jgi:hypothetical protein
VPARIASPGLCACVLVAPSDLTLGAAPRTRVSVVPLGADATVTLEGFDYPLARGVLPADACLGLGNFVAAEGSRVVAHEGVVAILVESGSESFGGAAAPQGETGLEHGPAGPGDAGSCGRGDAGAGA